MTWNSADETRLTIGRCLVVHPSIKPHFENIPDVKSGRNEDSRLEEATRLAEAIDLEIVDTEIVKLAKPRSASLMGSGTVERFAGYIAAHDIEVVVIDGALTPIQQRNLERSWKCKVIDRTGLILEIFGARARTKEGTLQVELAALSYQRSRLVRSWTHLERQRGGFGFMGGPGERQIEADRRMIDERITRLKRELKTVRRTRALHRQARQRVPYSVIALVGYTNSGKSTLFNALSDAYVMSKDQLFATLDPTMRRMKLPSGRETILSDTVGFVSDLPHELVEAFRATLEEVVEADILLHVRDISHRDTWEQKVDVENVLKNLVEDGNRRAIADTLQIEVLNKIDLLENEEENYQTNRVSRSNGEMVMVSAKTQEGFGDLLSTIDAHLTARRQEVTLQVGWNDGALLNWLYDRGEIIERRDKEKWVELKVRLEPEDIARYEQKNLPTDESRSIFPDS